MPPVRSTSSLCTLFVGSSQISAPPVAEQQVLEMRARKLHSWYHSLYGFKLGQQVECQIGAQFRKFVLNLTSTVGHVQISGHT